MFGLVNYLDGEKKLHTEHLISWFCRTVVAKLCGLSIKDAEWGMPVWKVQFIKGSEKGDKEIFASSVAFETLKP